MKIRLPCWEPDSETSCQPVEPARSFRFVSDAYDHHVLQEYSMCLLRKLEPSFGAGESSGLHAVGRAQFVDGIGKIIPNRTFCAPEFRRHFPAAFSFSGPPENLPLALGERIASASPRFRCEVRIDDPQAAMLSADSLR